MKKGTIALMGLLVLSAMGQAFAWEPTGDNYGRVKTINFDRYNSGDFSFVLTDGTSDSDPFVMTYDDVVTPMVLSMILTAKSADLPVHVLASPYWMVWQIDLGLQN